MSKSLTMGTRNIKHLTIRTIICTWSINDESDRAADHGTQYNVDTNIINFVPTFILYTLFF